LVDARSNVVTDGRVDLVHHISGAGDVDCRKILQDAGKIREKASNVEHSEVCEANACRHQLPP